MFGPIELLDTFPLPMLGDLWLRLVFNLFASSEPSSLSLCRLIFLTSVTDLLSCEGELENSSLISHDDATFDKFEWICSES